MRLVISGHAVERYIERVDSSATGASSFIRGKLEPTAMKFLEGANAWTSFRVHLSGVTYCIFRNKKEAVVATCFPDRFSPKLMRYKKS